MSSRRSTTAGPTPAPRLVALERWGLAACVAAAIVVRVALAASNSGITMDSPLYVAMADSIAAGQSAKGPAHHGYPALVAAVESVLPGRELPGRALSMIAGVVLVPLVYGLARRTLPRGCSLGAAALVAIHPLLGVYSGAIMTESLFLLVAYGGLLLVEMDRALAGGVGLGLGYLVRPEAAVLAIGGAPFTRRGFSGAVALMMGFAIAAAPYVGYLSLQRGALTLTPKEALVQPAFDTGAEAEWRIGSRDSVVSYEGRSLIDRLRWAAPSIASHYLPQLARHAARTVEAWPWPLLALSAIGLVTRGRALTGVLLLLLVMPLLAAPFELRFAQLQVPALAVFAAAGGAWLVERFVGHRRLVEAIVGLMALAGLAWCWAGPAGFRALHFDDGPMAEMKEVGAWLRANGRPGAIVMDRKSYVPFYAGMRHVQLPNDDYDVIVEYARTSGVDYLVVEEFVAARMRPQLAPLLADPAFRDAETRLRPLYVARSAPLTGVAVFEVVRESGVR